MAEQFSMPSMFDTRYAMDRQMELDAQKAGQVGGGGKRYGMYYNSSLLGDRDNASLMSLTGMMGGQGDPRMAKQQAIDTIMQQYPNPESFEDFQEIGNALRSSGLYEEAKRADAMASDMQTQALNVYKANTDRLNATSSASGTTYMQDLRDIAAKQLACDFNDPECAKAAQALWQDQKRAGVDESGAIAFIEADQKAFSEDLTTSSAMYKEANAYESTINQSLGFLDQGLYTGTGAETINKIKKAGIAFGMVDPGENATAEQFRVNSMKAIMAWVQKTKGAISEAEMQLFADASEGLGRTVAGNKLILLTAKGIVEYQQKLHEERIRWMKTTDNPTRLKWEANMIEWNQTNGNMLPSEEDIAAALGPVAVDSGIIEDDNVVITIVDQ
jgi:hypothetical protein